MSNCQKITELVNKGTLTRDSSGRIVKSDGSAIQRVGNETFVEAIEREQRPQSHLVTINNAYYGESSTESDEDSESNDESIEIKYDDVYVIQGNKYDAYAADKTEKRSTAKRREVLEGVYPPPLKRQSARIRKDKENMHAPRDEVKLNKPFPRPVQDHVKSAPPGMGEVKKVPVPVAEKTTKVPLAKQALRFNPQDDADMIEDEGTSRDTREGRKSQEVRNNEKKTQVTVPASDRKPVPRQSAVSAHVDPVNVMNQLLNTRITLAVGEVLGISRELSSMVSDSIKIKSVKPPLVPVGLATSFRPKTRGLLIKITLECDGVPIEAIIDTGSQLNIVSEAVYKSRIRRPIDHKSTVNMNDANGGERTLQGLVKNVPLTCGGVQTEANLYVGEHVPFQMLLGRPWQRGNYVSIDKRSDGTYLLFKDPKTLETRYEFLVTPDNMTTMEWDFEPSTWHITETPATYLIEVLEDEANHTQHKRQQIKALIRDNPVSDAIDRPCTDQATSAINYGKGQNQNMDGTLLHWIESFTEGGEERSESPERKLRNAIKEGRTYKQVPCRFLDTLPKPTNMALNVTSVPISSEVEDLPVLYSLAAPARSEADDLRDALHHEGFLHDQGYFSNMTLNSAQAYVTGYHADGQGNRYTAITGLRTVRTAFTANGPQTVYGHFTARLYTDLNPVPSSVIIPTFLQPTDRDDQDTYWVSRNSDPHAWTNSTTHTEWINYQPPANGDNPGTQGLVEGSDGVITQDKEPNPPPAYNPTTPLPQLSRSDSESTTDDENWLPCHLCFKTHGNAGCNTGTQYSLIRISSNGSVSSSVHLLDDPIKVERYGQARSEFHSAGTSSESEDSGQLVTSISSSDLSENDNLCYPPDRPSWNFARSIDSSTHSQSAPTLSNSELSTLVNNTEDEFDDYDDEELEIGILALWNEYRKSLTEERLEGYWGQTPYQIIMALDDDEIERLAEAAAATEYETTKLGKQIKHHRKNRLNNHSRLAHLARAGFPIDGPLSFLRSDSTVAQHSASGSESILVNSPVELTAQEARGLASHHRIAIHKKDEPQENPELGNRQSFSIPETYPFTYTSNYQVRPNACSPIQDPEPVAVYTARVAKPFAMESNHGSFYDHEHPDSNKFRTFLRSPAAWPTVPPVIVYANTSKHVKAWDVGAEPMSPDSETAGERPITNQEPTQPSLRHPHLPRSHPDNYQEMEPALRPSQERDTPPPETAASRYERDRTREHLERVRDEVEHTHPRTTERRSLFDEVIVHGDRRPLPTRPNTPEPEQPFPLMGEGLEQALANISAETQAYRTRVAELNDEKAKEEVNIRIMQVVGDEYQRAQIKTEPREPLLHKKASPLRKMTYYRHEYATNDSSDTQEDDSSDHSSSAKSLKRSTTPPQAPLSSITAPPLRSALIKPGINIPPPRRSILISKKPHGDTHATPLEELIIDKIPLHPREVPMAERPYLPERDYKAGTTRSRIGRVIALDVRTLHPVTGFENPPVTDAYIRFATVLTGDFEPYIFPDVVHNTPTGAYDLPMVRAKDWGTRVDEMFESRAAVLSIIRRVENAMSPAQNTELRRPLITMFVISASGALTEATVNRNYFFRTLHPNYNPFMDTGEATFLRGASYYFRRVQHHILADAIDVLLRSPQYDDFYCRKLLEIGCLDHHSPFQRERALAYIKLYEDEILDDEEDDEKEASMEIESDHEPDSNK